MTTLFLLIPLAGLFVAAYRRTRMIDIPGRVERFSRGLDVLLRFMPVLAVAVFAMLFVFILKGRLYERLSHAVLVFALWLYAARFYWMLISFFKDRQILVISAPGMACSAAAAIILTPLDRYVDLLHSFTGAGSILAGCGLLAVYYAAPVLFPRKTAKHKQAQDRAIPNHTETS